VKKIDVRNITEWKITCELMDFSLEVGKGLEFDDLVVDLSKKNNLDLPKRTSKPSILSLTGLDKHKSGKARQVVLSEALKTGYEYDQHVYLINLAELDEACIEWLIKRQGTGNVLVINNVSQKTDQAYLRALRDAGFKAILWSTTSEDLVGIPQYLPNTDWFVIEGKMPRNSTVKSRLSNIYWECFHRNIPFWSDKGISLEKLLKEGTKQAVSSKQSLQDAPGYDFPDLGEYVLWDSQLDKEIDGKRLHSKVLNAQGQLTRSTMQLAYRLFQLNETAIKAGKRAFYQLNFGVSNFGSYCEDQLGIKANLGSQYLVAIRTVNALDQYLLQSVFDPGEEEPKILPLGYTRYRDESKYLGRILELKSTDASRFEKLRAKIFDPALSNRDVISATETELGIKHKKKTLVQANPDPTTSLKTRIIKIGSDLKSIVNPQKSEEVDKILLQLLALLPLPVDTETENPFEEEFGISGVSTPDPLPKKKVSRETLTKSLAKQASSAKAQTKRVSKVVVTKIPSLKHFIQAGSGWVKKGLCNDKIDLLGLCGFGCSYCSTDSTTYLRMNRRKFETLTMEQNEVSYAPRENPLLTYEYEDVIPKLEQELDSYHKGKGKGRVLAFSKLTDAFSPRLVSSGITKKALELIFKHTEYRVRIMTKSAVLGKSDWVSFLSEHKDRIVVGFSTGSLNDAWAKKVEVGTGIPSKRLEALEKLQNAGVPTYGMLCPMFPEMLDEKKMDDLLNRISPSVVETIWAEPYNDRANWRVVREGFDRSSDEYSWFTKVYENGDKDLWSEYATRLYTMLLERAQTNGWTEKLRYLLYEGDIKAWHAPKFNGLRGVLLQGDKDKKGESLNPHFVHLDS